MIALNSYLEILPTSPPIL